MRHHRAAREVDKEEHVTRHETSLRPDLGGEEVHGD